MAVTGSSPHPPKKTTIIRKQNSEAKYKSSGPADRPGLKRKENTEPVIAKKMRVLKPKRKNMEAEHWSDSDSLDLSEIDWSDDENE